MPSFCAAFCLKPHKDGVGLSNFPKHHQLLSKGVKQAIQDQEKLQNSPTSLPCLEHFQKDVFFILFPHCKSCYSVKILHLLLPAAVSTVPRSSERENISWPMNQTWADCC